MDTVRNHSKKRDAIYAVLAGTKSHPTAEWVFRELKDEYPDLSLGTVYRNLKLFQQEGSAVSVATVNGTERFDANTKPHTHFICECCGRVDDLPTVKLPLFVLNQVWELNGQRPRGWDLNFHGICPDCQAQEKSSYE